MHVWKTATVVTHQWKTPVKDNFYQQLDLVTQDVHPHDPLIVLGDLNAATGSDRHGFESVLGPYGCGNLNHNTDHLPSYCATFGLSVVES